MSSSTRNMYSEQTDIISTFIQAKMEIEVSVKLTSMGMKEEKIGDLPGKWLREF